MQMIYNLILLLTMIATFWLMIQLLWLWKGRAVFVRVLRYWCLSVKFPRFHEDVMVRYSNPHFFLPGVVLSDKCAMSKWIKDQNMGRVLINEFDSDTIEILFFRKADAVLFKLNWF